MVMPGETAGFDGVVCRHDGEGEPTQLELKVCRSAAGYYLGYWCPQCGPYSRESGYYATSEEAEKDLQYDPEARSRLLDAIP